MSYYNGDHSLIIGEKNTWTDWHLIPAKRPSVSMPQIRTKFIEIPGAFGTLDLTELLTGCPVYGDRTGSWEFIMDPDREDMTSWANLYQTIAMYVHGRRRRVVFTDDPEYYYEGRLAVAGLEPEEGYTTLTINYELDPYKLPVHDPFDTGWLWDPFDFETGVIPQGRSTTISGTTTVTLYGKSEDYSPAFKCSSAMTLEYEDRRYSLISGVNYLHEIIIQADDPSAHSFKFTGNGTVQISEMGARL